MNSEESQCPEKKTNSSPTARSKADSWFVFREQKHFGPFTTNSVLIFLRRGFLSKDHHVWQQGQSTWSKIADMEVFNVPIAEEALKMSDEEFVQISGIKREHLTDFYKQHQSQAHSEQAESKARLTGVTDLYESIKSKLNFRIKDDITDMEGERIDLNKKAKTEKV
ncbi:MAG: DUF4339 domain-containing protein [Bdellovibrionaceae bacterium]|nr:DUF4339 domain-containing protein [Pseudobdellovibrionaceae bacterium]